MTEYISSLELTVARRRARLYAPSAAQYLAARDAAQGIEDEEKAALYFSAALISKTLYDGDAPLFEDAEGVLDALTREQMAELESLSASLSGGVYAQMDEEPAAAETAPSAPEFIKDERGAYTEAEMPQSTEKTAETETRKEAARETLPEPLPQREAERGYMAPPSAARISRKAAAYGETNYPALPKSEGSAGAGMAEISEYFERDARRYDCGFQ